MHAFKQVLYGCCVLLTSGQPSSLSGEGYLQQPLTSLVVVRLKVRRVAAGDVVNCKRFGWLKSCPRNAVDTQIFNLITSTVYSSDISNWLLNLQMRRFDYASSYVDKH